MLLVHSMTISTKYFFKFTIKVSWIFISNNRQQDRVLRQCELKVA